MVNLRLQKKLAAKVLKVGKDKVWLDPTKIKEIKEAITKADIRRLILKGYIKVLKKGKVKKERKKGKKGPGKRKGTKYSRLDKKRVWINRVRSQRKLLRELKEKGKIDNLTYRKLYLMVKGGFFRSRSHLLLYAKQHGLIKGD
jgi:large subunit ribosomal protein L19e